MAIDVRANVTCSLGGELISGSLSDDYLQGSGLIKTKGECELTGLHTPAAGTEVTFSYERNGTTVTVPRRLRVLSSFADPFRNTTKVELGCFLTYMQDVGPTPTVDGQSSKTTGRQQQCLNGNTDYPADSQVPIPISAAAIFEQCLTRLGLTASGNPLTNWFFKDSFDLSAGYVTVIGDLLVSESFFGYIDSNETLQIRDLTVEGGGGPVIDNSNLIDLDQVGVGGLPGDAVVVRYDSLVLAQEPDLDDEVDQRKRNWEEEEIIGEPETHVVRFTDANGDTVENSYSYIPYQKTVTTYGDDDSFDPDTCILVGREGADLSDSPILSEVDERILFAEAANNYCGQVLAVGAQIDPSTTQEFRTQETEYRYDEKGELVETISYSYEPFYKWAGGLDVQFVYETDAGTEWVSLGSGSVLVEKVITKNDNIYAAQSGVYLTAGEELVPVVEAQKVTTERYLNYALTPQGQQAIAQIKDETPFTSAGQCLGWLESNSRTLVLADGQVQINRGRDIVQGQKRASQADRIGGANGSRPETTAHLIYADGAAGAQRTITMTMPYQPDDRYTSTGQIIKSDVAAKALRYGRAQNRLLLGNRYGVNLQVHPDRMPANPFDPLYVSNGSTSVQYRANGTSWAFSKDGVIGSLDALYWGVAGGDFPAWVPVAPGVGSFPSLPIVDPDGNTDVDSVVPPWNETLPMIGVTHTKMTFKGYSYTLDQGETDLGTLVTRTGMSILEVIGHDDMIAVTRTEVDVEESGGPGPGGLEIVAGDEAPLLGAAPVVDETAFDDEWTVILYDPGLGEDDSAWNIDVQGWLTIDSNNYTAGGVSSNGYFTWPTLSTTYQPSVTNPALDKLFTTAGDLKAGTIAYTLGNNYLRFRIELWGYSSSATGVDNSYEVTFFEPGVNGEQYIEVRYGDLNLPDIDNLVDLMICDTATAYAQTTQQANSSYVLEGNATGTTWTIHENAHVSNPDGKFVVRLPDAVTRTKSILAANPSTYAYVDQYTSDGVQRVINVDDFYTAWVFNHRANWFGLNAWGPLLAQQCHTTNSIPSSVTDDGYLNFLYGGYEIGTASDINSSTARVQHLTVLGADGPVSQLTSGDVPVDYQKSPGMFFFHFTSDGATELTIPHTLGAVPKYIYTRRVGPSDQRPRASGSMIGAGNSLYLNSTNGITADQTGNFYYKAFDASTITYDSFFAQAGECVGFAFADSPDAVHADTFASTGTAANAITGVGFQPKWVLLKSLDGTSDHLIFNTDLPAGECVKLNAFNTANATNRGTLTFDADGFTYTGNQSDAGNNWMYVALA